MALGTTMFLSQFFLTAQREVPRGQEAGLSCSPLPVTPPLDAGSSPELLTHLWQRWALFLWWPGPCPGTVVGSSQRSLLGLVLPTACQYTFLSFGKGFGKSLHEDPAKVSQQLGLATFVVLSHLALCCLTRLCLPG